MNDRDRELLSESEAKWNALAERRIAIEQQGAALNRRYDASADGSHEKRVVMRELSDLDALREQLERDETALFDSEEAER